MDESQNQSGVPPTTAPEPVSQLAPQPMEEKVKEKKGSAGVVFGVVAVVVVALAAGAFVYLNNNKADENGIVPNEVVATVNGVDIIGADLSTSMNQIAATAQLQGIDTTDPNIQSEIQAQAVEMLINTQLLEEEAADRGVDITDADVAARIEALVQEIGSQEALEERMEALGIDDETLRRDVKSELMIQALLDDVFAVEVIEVTEEEVQEFYEVTTGGSEGAPSLEDVRAQIEAQIRASKEQVVIDEFITELRTDAEIEIAE